MGLGLAALYLLVALATAHLSGRPLRPLFDGFAPPAPYKWVNPPPEFARDNVKPSEATQQVPLDAGGSTASNSATPDGQAIAGLDNGSVPPHPPDTSVTLRVTPVDPGTLGALPAGQRAEGNAYQVTLGYGPSGTPVTGLAKPGTMALTAAAPATTLLFSPDGRAWQDTAAKPFGDGNGLFAPMVAPGYYVPVSHNRARARAADGTGKTALVAVLVIVALAGLAIGLLVARRSRPRTAGGRGSPARP